MLGLDEQASENDIRLAYYGLQKAIEAQDFSDNEHITLRVNALRDRTKEARDFLLAHGTGAAGTSRGATTGGARRTGGAVGRAFSRKKAPGKLSVTSDEEKKARLDGLESVRVCLLTYRDGQASKRLTSLVVILICIVVGFIVLRYIRAMPPRIISFSVIALAAVAASTTFTTSHLQCRNTKRHVMAIDEQIDELRRDLGLDDPEGDFDGDGVPNGEEPRTGLAGLAASRAGRRSSGISEAIEGVEIPLADGADAHDGRGGLDALAAGDDDEDGDDAWDDPEDADIEDDELDDDLDDDDPAYDPDDDPDDEPAPVRKRAHVGAAARGKKEVSR